MYSDVIWSWCKLLIPSYHHSSFQIFSLNRFTSFTRPFNGWRSQGANVDLPASMERLLVPTKSWAQRIGIRKTCLGTSPTSAALVWIFRSCWPKSPSLQIMKNPRHIQIYIKNHQQSDPSRHTIVWNRPGIIRRLRNYLFWILWTKFLFFLQQKILIKQLICI